ncbi:MAG: type I polyketide synthase [Xenococcaceae cyanobacterium]
MQFGLMLFGSSQDALAGDKYRLVIESARFADEHDFSSVWTPERHFTQLGCLYSNPSVINAALARETRRVRLQSGSVVLPLHNPIRIAEEWSIVDNLSGGRVATSFASGWNPNDFAFFPEKYKNRHRELFVGVETVRKLWQGESIQVKSGNGNLVDVKIYPTPIQPELPIWITAVGHPQTFATAGEIGANILTSLLGQQSIEDLQQKIALYRQTRSQHGHNPDTGIVSIMLHTFVGEDLNTVRDMVRVPYCKYIKSNFDLFSQGLPQSRGYSPDKVKMSDKDLDEFVNLLFEQFASSRGLIGTPESCLTLIEQLDRIGINEIACLLDFGQSQELILEHLPELNKLRETYNAKQGSLVPRQSLGTVAGGRASSQPLPGGKASYARSASSQPLPGGRASHARSQAEPRNEKSPTVSEIRGRCPHQKSGAEFYASLHESGMELGETYQGIETLWLGEGEALAKVKLPSQADASDKSIKIHPALLDACHQVMGAALVSTNSESFYIPIGIRSFQIHKSMSDRVFSYAVVPHPVGKEADLLEGNVRIFDEEDNLLVEVRGLQMQKADNLFHKTSFQDKYADWLYEMQWQSSPLPERDLPTDNLSLHLPERELGSWIVFADHLGVGQRLARFLEAGGESCFVVHCGETNKILDKGEIQLNPADPEGMEKYLGQLLATAQLPCRGIVHLWSLDVKPGKETTFASLHQDGNRTVISMLHLVQTVAQITTSPSPSLWFVTRDVQKVGSEVIPRSPVQAPVWGFGRVVATELPHIWGKLVDIDSEDSVDEAANQLLRELQTQDGEDQIVFRQGQRYIVRLVPTQKKETQPISFLPSATYLISGGLGYFGLNAARWMVESGAKHLVLLGRSGVSDGAREAIARWENLGVQVLVLQADVSDPEQMSAVLEKVKATCPPLKGIFHLAGFNQGKPVQDITPDELESMLRPKVLGTWILHQLTLEMNLDFFFSSSSMSPVFGSKGLAHYAAANYFLDVFAHYRHSLGLPGLTINIGALAGGGMAFSMPEAQRHTTGVGLNVTEPTDILAVVGSLLNRKDVANIIVADMDWSVFKPLYESASGSKLLANIEARSPESVDGRETAKFRQQLQSAPQSDRMDLLITYLQGEVAKVLRYLGNQQLPDPEQGFFALGMDSLMAVDLRNRLSESLGCSLPTALIFEYSNIVSLAEYIAQEVLCLKLLRESQEISVSVDNEKSNENNMETELAKNIEELSDLNLEDIIDRELAELME